MENNETSPIPATTTRDISDKIVSTRMRFANKSELEETNLGLGFDLCLKRDSETNNRAKTYLGDGARATIRVLS